MKEAQFTRLRDGSWGRSRRFMIDISRFSPGCSHYIFFSGVNQLNPFFYLQIGRLRPTEPSALPRIWVPYKKKAHLRGSHINITLSTDGMTNLMFVQRIARSANRPPLDSSELDVSETRWQTIAISEYTLLTNDIVCATVSGGTFKARTERRRYQTRHPKLITAIFPQDGWNLPQSTSRGNQLF